MILAAGCTQPAVEKQQVPGTSVVNITVPFGPIPVESTDGVNLAYELELRAPGEMTLVPKRSRSTTLRIRDLNTGC